MNWLLAGIIGLMPTYLLRFSILGIPTSFLELLIYAVSLIGGVMLVQRQMYRDRLGRRLPWLVPAGLLILGAGIGVIVSPDQQAALGLFKGYIIDPILVYGMILVFIVGADDTRRLIRAAVGSGVVIALLAIIQAGCLHEVRALGIYRLDAASSPNYLAFALAPLVPLVGAVAIRQSWLRFVIGILLLLALFLSGSRAGLVAAGTGFMISVVLSSEQFWKQRLIQSICMIALGLGLVGSWLVVRPDFSASSETGGRIASSNNIRWQIWGVTGELVRVQPLIGLGLGNYQRAFGELTLRRVNFPEYITPEARTPHNLAVGLWTDTGILGLLAFMTVLVLVGKSLAVAVKQPAERALAAALIGSWFVLLAHGLVDMPIWKNDLMVLFWLLVALPILITFKQDRRSLPL